MRIQTGRPSRGVGLRYRDEVGEVVLAVDEIVGTRGETGFTEVGEVEWAAPGLAPVVRVVEARRPVLMARHADGHCEVGVCEVDAAGAIDRQLATRFGSDAGDDGSRGRE